jgi:hypothetical protein
MHLQNCIWLKNQADTKYTRQKTLGWSGTAMTVNWTDRMHCFARNKSKKIR